MQRTHSRIRALAARVRHEEDGFASSVILAVCTLLLVFAALQAGIWYVGTTVAQNAATAGYTVARAYQATGGAGSDAARQVIDGMHGYLHDPHITVDHTATTVTVTVTGDPVSFLPGVDLGRITRTTTGPVERWVPAP